MRDLAGEFSRFLERHPADFYWIGYSGGIDSHVLLHLCAQLQATLGPVFGAVHVNHGLHPEADAHAEHCLKTCAGLGLPCRILAVDARPRPGESPEEAARNARYRAWAEWLEPNAALLVAQHQDDQAETVLLQMLRGAGPAGMAGMAPAARLGRGRLLRPLLEVPKEELRDYARRAGLVWVDDPSNADESLDRNYLRRRILPLLKARWPACVRTIARSAKHCAEAQRLVEEITAPHLEAAVDPEGGLDLKALAVLDRSRQRWLVRAWLKRQGFRSPPAVLLDRVLDEAVAAAPDRQPRIEWAEGIVCRYRGKLYALRPAPLPDPAWQTSWDGQTPLLLPDRSVLEPKPAEGKGVAVRFWRQGEIEVCYRRGGERCRLPGRKSRPLKKLLQEQGVPLWVRPRLPLVYLHGRLALVADLWACEPFAAGPNEVGVTLSWRPGLGRE
ncbi:tRNA lysidine(34) synthetase TilS [Methylothermus subterraneus]